VQRNADDVQLVAAHHGKRVLRLLIRQERAQECVVVQAIFGEDGLLLLKERADG